MKSFAFSDLDQLLEGVIQNLTGKPAQTENPNDVYKLLEETPETETSSFGSQVLSNAQADLGVREDLGKNDGRRIREYFKYFNMGGGQDWCAAAVSAWMKEAGGGPVSGSVGARAIAAQFAAAGKWVPKNKITPQVMVPGNIVVWSRGGPESYKGHIGVLESFDGRSNFTSIEANSGPKSDSVVRNSHSINDGNFLGVGILSDNIPNNSKRASVKKVVKLSNIYFKLIYGADSVFRSANYIVERVHEIISSENDIRKQLWSLNGVGNSIRNLLNDLGLKKESSMFHSMYEPVSKEYLQLQSAIDLIFEPRNIKLTKFRQDVINMAPYYKKIAPKKIHNLAVKFNPNLGGNDLYSIYDLIVPAIEFFADVMNILLNIKLDFREIINSVNNEKTKERINEKQRIESDQDFDNVVVPEQETLEEPELMYDPQAVEDFWVGQHH